MPLYPLTGRVMTRLAVLQVAAELAARDRRRHHLTPDDRDTAILATADRFYQWVQAPTRWDLTVGPVTKQSTGALVGPAHTEGHTVQIHDDEQFTLTATPVDAKGFDTSDTLSWSSSDDTVATVTVSDDTLSATIVAGTPGSAVITVTDGTTSATEAVDVLAGDATAFTLVEGPVTKQ